MREVWACYRLALADLTEPAYRLAFGRALALTLLSFVLAGAALAWTLAGASQTFLPDWAWLEWQWVDWLIRGLSGIAFVAAVFFLFPILVGSFIGFFLNDVAAAIERRHYPNAGGERTHELWSSMAGALKSFATVLGLNLLMLPVYLILLFLPPLNLIVFYLFNGYLLGCEYFELAGLRHLDSRQIATVLARKRSTVALAGVVLAGLLSLPLINLFAPVLATAAMVHLLQSSAGKLSAEKLPGG